MKIFSSQRLISRCLLSLLAGLAFIYSAIPAQAGHTVYVLPVQGEVGPGMAAFLERGLREIAAMQAESGGEYLYVLELDTFGGRVDSAFRIVDALLEIPEGKTVAFVQNKAISAGAMIALANSKLVMRPSSTIGDAAPIAYSGEGPQELGEKFQSPLRAKFRAMANRNGYPAVLAEAMVTADLEIQELVFADATVRYIDSRAYEELTAEERSRVTSRRTIVPAGQLLTMDDREALRYGFSSMTAASIPDLLAAMGIEEYNLVRLEQNWSENLAILIASIAPILLMIGLAALYTELRAPGFGVPGFIGVVCLGLVFFSQHMVGLANYTELLLIALGIVLLGLELLVLPGFGIAGLAGLLAISLGLVLSFQDFVIPNPALPWQQELLFRNLVQVLGSLVAAIFFSFMLLRLLPRLGRMSDGFYLGTTLASSRLDSRESRQVRIGDAGRAQTDLRPAGKAFFAETLCDVITEGEFIEKGSPLTIIRMSGSRIVVGRGGEREAARG
jgi:membrane-bound serine protease (ClpP class)